MKRAIFAALSAVIATGALLAPASPASAVAATIYEASDSSLAPNLPSVGGEAYAFDEIGDEVEFAGLNRRLSTVSVTMSSWACQQGTWNGGNCATTDPSLKGSVPITLNIYGPSVPGPDGTVVPGTLIKSLTQTFAVPYRPGANLQKCPGGQWYNKKDQTCYNGKAFPVTWKLKPYKLIVPDGAVISVAYNTSHYGYNPIGTGAACYSTPQGCIYDSLNVGLDDDGTIETGSKTHPGTVFQNTPIAGFLCDGTPDTDVFNLDSPTNACWSGYDIAMRVVAL